MSPDAIFAIVAVFAIGTAFAIGLCKAAAEGDRIAREACERRRQQRDERIAVDRLRPHTGVVSPAPRGLSLVAPDFTNGPGEVVASRGSIRTPRRS